MLLVAALSLVAVIPGVIDELGLPSSGNVKLTPVLGANYIHAQEFGSWALAVIVGLLVAANAREEPARVIWFSIVLAAPYILLASGWDAERSVASALRWYAAGFLLLGSAALSARSASVLRNRLRSVPPQQWFELRALLFVLTIGPILGLTLYPSLMALKGSNIAGPLADSFFAKIGDSLSYVVPLLIVSGTLVGHALRERSGPHALAAAAVLNLTVSLAYLLGLTKSGAAFSWGEAVQLTQFNLIVTAGFALAWMTVSR